MRQGFRVPPAAAAVAANDPQMMPHSGQPRLLPRCLCNTGWTGSACRAVPGGLGCQAARPRVLTGLRLRVQSFLESEDVKQALNQSQSALAAITVLKKVSRAPRTGFPPSRPCSITNPECWSCCALYFRVL